MQGLQGVEDTNKGVQRYSEEFERPQLRRIVRLNPHSLVSEFHHFTHIK